jgi:high-affinity Fe2+/Pb2+ permease
VNPAQTSLSDRTRAFERSRVVTLLASAAAFVAWQLADLGKGVGPGARAPLIVVSTLGAIAWGAATLRTVRLARALRRDRALASAVNDERTRAARVRALALAFWAVLLAQASILVAGIVGRAPSGATAARLTIIVGVVAAIVAFVVYDRE